jgi:hypothetical protein
VIGRRHVLRLLIFAILAVIACNEPRPPDEFLWEETFEEPCDDGVPCGWERIGGSAEDVRYVETSLHPGEHGIALSGEGSVRGAGGESMQVAFNLGTLEARIVGRCDAGAGIDVEVGIEQLAPLDAGSAFDDTMPATIFLPESWSEASQSIPVTSASAFVDGGVGSMPGLQELRITSVVLTMNGPGTCEIAEILIDATSTARRSLDDGC